MAQDSGPSPARDALVTGPANGMEVTQGLRLRQTVQPGEVADGTAVECPYCYALVLEQRVGEHVASIAHTQAQA